jgi:hypothetical protein
MEKQKWRDFYISIFAATVQMGGKNGAESSNQLRLCVEMLAGGPFAGRLEIGPASRGATFIYEQRLTITCQNIQTVLVAQYSN